MPEAECRIRTSQTAFVLDSPLSSPKQRWTFLITVYCFAPMEGIFSITLTQNARVSLKPLRIKRQPHYEKMSSWRILMDRFMSKTAKKTENWTRLKMYVNHVIYCHVKTAQCITRTKLPSKFSKIVSCFYWMTVTSHILSWKFTEKEP